MKKICLLVAIAFVATSCLQDLDRKDPGPEQTTAIPADFRWQTTQDTEITVGAPTVAGVSQSANIRIYSSPVLYDENIAAKGVAVAGGQFRTAVTLPASVGQLYVQATLPDGTTSVREVAVTRTIHVPGAELTKAHVAAAPKTFAALATRAASSMPDFPTVTAKSESDFDSRAVIREIGNGNYQLGASWAFFAAPEYLIPTGAQINGGIDLNGGFSPYRTPVLYVAGKLEISSLSIGSAQLVVLPGGEVKVSTLMIQPSSPADKAAVYVLEGGKITMDKPNFSGKFVVNEGEFVINGDLDLNNSQKFYNTSTAKLTLDELKLSNSVMFYNDGVVECENLKLNSNSEFHNCENAKLEAVGESVNERNTTIYQRGAAHFEELTLRGAMYVYCYTLVDEFSAEGAEIHIASGASLDTEDSEFNNSTLSLSSGAMFVAEEYNADKTGGKNTFTSGAGAGLMPVVIFKEKAYTRQGHVTDFEGRMEIVYDNDADSEYVIRGSYLSGGAVVRKAQTVVIPGTVCNGGKAPVEPEPDPLPESDYSIESGAPFTYCFEDNWPWLGDYDMNDVVLLTGVDRERSKDGSLVKSIVINWTLKAAGAAHKLACAVQLDQVLASEIESVVSTHSMGSGPFSAGSIEAGSEQAVIPFFNWTDELLSKTNTYKGVPPVEPTKQKTTITFKQPIEIAKVKESAMNFFIVVNERSKEVHMPSYSPTAFGVIGGGFCTPEDPYRFFVAKGDQKKNNYLMWALIIPGDFRYPAENKDVRDAYKSFNAWAQSGGKVHADWYSEENGVDEELLY